MGLCHRVLPILFLTSILVSQAGAGQETFRATNPSMYKKVTPVSIRRLSSYTLNLRNIKPVTSEKPAKPQGPDPTANFDLSDVIDNSELLEDMTQACGWDPHIIFQDKAAGHYFYYVPRELLLLHDENGYRLSAQYNHNAKPDEPSVMLTAEIASPYREGDALLLKAVLREAFGLRLSDPLEVRSLAALGATADLQAVATGLAIPTERIHLTALSNFKQPFRMTLALTQEEVEEVLAQIGREGLVGSLHVKVGAEPFPIPIRVRYSLFAGKRVGGFDEWAKGNSIEKLTNLTAFPLRDHYKYAYSTERNQLQRIHKSVKTAKPIPPTGSCPFKLPDVERVLGKNVLVSWLSTSLDTDCDECLASLSEAARRGVALAPSASIVFEAIPGVFSELGLYKILVRVRSPYFVTGESRIKQREIQLTEEGNLNSELTIYVPEHRGSEPLLYRYQIHAVRETGEVLSETDWHDGHGMNQFLGSDQLEPLMAAPEQP